MDNLNLALPLQTVARPESRDYIIRDAQGAWRATTGDQEMAARIAACVNACDGLATSWLEQGLLCAGLNSMDAKRQCNQLLREISTCVDREGWVIPARWDDFAVLVERIRTMPGKGTS